MGYFSCNSESAIAACDPYNWELTQKQKSRRINKTRDPIKIREFSYAELDAATNGFSSDSFLGKGSHGSVYRAVLEAGKLVVAVKRTAVASSNLPESFNTNNSSNSHADNEIEILSRVRSPRVVNLIGFASDPKLRKLVVVEFMPNGSLYELMHEGSRPPGWSRRVRFAVQIARAVQDLHSSNPPVIHRDIKSSNVLIDVEGNARLGDFGLALRGHVEDIRVKCTPPAGTLGYLDPGYLAPGDLSTKSDVFSFGILLLEIISGRNAIDVNFSPPSVVDWAAPLIRGGDYEAICDQRIGPPEDPLVARRLAVLAGRCVKSAAEKRPEMAEVVECLQAVKKRVAWRRVSCVRKSSPQTKYEPLEENAESTCATGCGNRWNRKVSNVPVSESANDATGRSSDRVPRSRSMGSVREIKNGPSDRNLGRRQGVGLTVKMPTARLRKSRSMGMLHGPRLINTSSGNGFVLQLVRNHSVGDLEESKLLINVEKRGTEADIGK